MNLSFSILWVEDDYGFFSSAKELIESFLEDYCIEPLIDYKQTLSVEDTKKIGKKYDVIFVDYILSSDSFGTELIYQIRSNSLLPDIVFYSSLNSFEEIMAKEKEDGRTDLVSILKNGIYFTSSKNMAETAIGVIKKILARDEKINGFKGLVLSSISRFETDVDELLLTLTNRMSKEQKEKLYSYIYKHMVEEDIKKIGDYYLKPDSPVSESLPKAICSENRYLNHNKRVRVMKEALKILNIYDFDADSYFGLTRIRNSLGHIPTNSEILNEPIVINVGKDKIVFDHQFVVNTRRDINHWRDVFKDLKERVK